MSSSTPPRRTAPSLVQPEDPAQQSTVVDINEEDRVRVLVVDDDERNLMAIRTVLEDVAEVVEASSGEEALRHLLKGEFAVILLDVFMPGIDGYETAQIIRSREQTRRIPIVFLSAVNKENQHLMRGYAMGAVDYVFKPVDAVVLRSKVAVFVDLFMMNREIKRKALEEQRLLDANLRANQERLRVEQELRLAEQRQAAIIQSLPILLYLEALDSRPRWPAFVSGNFEAVTGYTYDYVSNNSSLWEERIHEDDRARVLAALAERAKTGSFAIEYRWLCGDGTYKYFLDQAVLLYDEIGTPTQYAGTLLDVTDRKELEDQLVHARKMDAIGKLTGGIAHDFNNLLAAVLGGLGLIERRITLNDEQKRIIDMTRHAAEQGSELVGRLLAFARRQKLEPAAIPFERLSKTVNGLLSHTLGGLVRLDWKGKNDLWCAYADEAQLELALMNLIINARDAMPKGGHVRVSGANRSVTARNEFGVARGDYVVLTVEDDGCGIPPELIEQVSEPFFTTKEIGKGTGLGLSMVYGFTQQSGGTMRIESVVGKGTRVELWLPRAAVEASAAKAKKNPDHAEGETLPPCRILLVDDHPGVRETTAALLQDMGHTVSQAEDAAAMLRILGSDPECCDVVVTDYAMPLVSGSEAIRRAREVRPGLPGIIITGYAEAEAVSNLPDQVIVLVKPFSHAELASALGAVSQGSEDALTQ